MASCVGLRCRRLRYRRLVRSGATRCPVRRSPVRLPRTVCHARRNRGQSWSRGGEDDGVAAWHGSATVWRATRTSSGRPSGRSRRRSASSPARPLTWCACSWAGTSPTTTGAVAERVRMLCPGATLLGCSAAGVIGDGLGVEAEHAVSVWVASLPGRAHPGVPPRGHAQPRRHGGRRHARAAPGGGSHHPARRPVLLPGRRLRRAGQRAAGSGADDRRHGLGPRWDPARRGWCSTSGWPTAAPSVSCSKDRSPYGRSSARAVVRSGRPWWSPGPRATRSSSWPGVNALERLEQIVAALDPDDQALVERRPAVRRRDGRVRRRARARLVPHPQRAGSRP